MGVADQDAPRPARCSGKLTYAGGPYHLTGAFLAQGAAVLLYDKRLVNELGGGCVTPAVLGEAFIERAADVGVKIETTMV